MPERATAAALGAIAFWSALAALALRLRHLPPFLTLGIAFLLGAAVGAKGLRRLPPARVLLLGVGGLFGYHLCLFTALRLAPPVEANLLNYLWPLLIVTLSPALLPGTRLETRHVVGAALGFAGAALLVARGGAGFSPAYLPGYALGAAAAVVWAVYSLLTKRLGGVPTSTVSWFCLVSGLLALACHAAFEPRAAAAAADVPVLLVMGLGPLGASFYLWDRAMKDGDPRVIGTLSYLTPLLSTLWIAALGEGALTASSGAAAALIVGGAAVGSLSPRRPRRG